jgi:hypothetical protein
MGRTHLTKLEVAASIPHSTTSLHEYICLFELGLSYLFTKGKYLSASYLLRSFELLALTPEKDYEQTAMRLPPVTSA